MSAERLYEQSLELIKAALPPAEQLLLIWVLREHSLEADMLREQINILKPIVDRYEAELSARSDLLVQRADELQRKCELLDEEEAKRRVNEMIDEEDAKPAETVDRSDTSGEHVDEEPAESTQPADKRVCPYVLDDGMPAGEARRIKACVEVAKTSLDPWQFCRVVELGLRNATPTQISEAIDVKPSVIGPQLRAADKHIKELSVHPREGWRSHYLRELWAHIERQRR